MALRLVLIIMVIIHLDIGRLLKYRVPAEFVDIEVPVLETYTEALSAMPRILYKESIYTLNDYVTARLWSIYL